MRFPRLTKRAGIFMVGAFVFLLFGVFILPWMIWSRERVEAMLRWPEIDARIVSVDTESTYRRPAGARYRHRISYGFDVENQSYLGDRISYGGKAPEWGLESDAREALPAVGSMIQIRYNPAAPDDCVIHVLRTSDSHEWRLRWFAGGVAAAGGLLMLASGLLWRPERK